MIPTSLSAPILDHVIPRTIQVPTVEEMAMISRMPPTDSIIVSGIPQLSSLFNPSAEDATVIIGNALVIFQSYHEFGNDNKTVFFPYSMYLPTSGVKMPVYNNGELISEVELINNRQDPLSGTTYHLGSFYNRCGQLYEILSKEKLPENSYFIIPEEYRIPYTMYEPPDNVTEGTPLNPPLPSKSSITWSLDGLKPQENAGLRGRSMGERSPGKRTDEDWRSEEAWEYVEDSDFCLWPYAFSSEEFMALTKYIRHFGRVAESLISACGVKRFLFQSMGHEMTVRRHSEIERRNLRIFSRRICYKMTTSTVLVKKFGTLRTISVKTSQ